MMSLARRVPESANQVRQGIWKPWGPEVLLGAEFYKATLGIIGLGRIGQAVARRASGFNMRILYHNPKPKPELEKQLGLEYASLDTLLKESDFVSIHAYLSPTTIGMIGKKQFEMMKNSAYLINTARGAMVKSQDLLDAVMEKRIAGAALDVFDPEPIPPDSPLLAMDNVIVTPHIASASLKTRQIMADMTVDHLLSGLKNEHMKCCANPEVYN
jgi:glyoxylate reductase